MSVPINVAEEDSRNAVEAAQALWTLMRAEAGSEPVQSYIYVINRTTGELLLYSPGLPKSKEIADLVGINPKAWEEQ